MESATKPLQTTGMDPELRNSLWNAFATIIVSALQRSWGWGDEKSRQGANAAVLGSLWVHFYKWPIDTLDLYAASGVDQVRRWFFDKATPWDKVYQFVEFIANLKAQGLEADIGAFVEVCNHVLERECSAYRFVGTKLSPITNEAEIKAVEDAAALDDSPLRPVSTHIDAALKLLSDRKQPDYRNSMKESISAVEALCKIIAQNDKATLGPALDAVKGKAGLHPKLHEAFKTLYGYTSDTHGIRHALKDDAEPEAEDAWYMLVSCSAFVNFLVEKARKKGLLA